MSSMFRMNNQAQLPHPIYEAQWSILKAQWSIIKPQWPVTMVKAQGTKWTWVME